MEQITKRFDYIDFMRGIAMLLVLYGHCAAMNMANITLNSFHMPLFFFVSGMCLKADRGGYKTFLLKKVKSLLVPQISLGFLLILESLVFDVVISKRLTFAEIDYWNGFLWWFLLVLFFDYAIIYWIVNYVKHKKVLLGLTVFIALIFYVCSYNCVTYLQQTLAALVFSLAGFLLRPYLDKWNQCESKLRGTGWLLLLMIPLVMFYIDPIYMYNNQYGNKIIFLIVAFLGILGTIDLSCSLKAQYFLSWVGKNSITIYITQFFLIRLVKGVFVRLPESLNFLDTGIIFFIVIMVSELVVVSFVNKYIPFIIGRKYE